MNQGRKKHTSRNTTSDGYAYLTKRTLLSRARIAGKLASKNAMEIMGYVMTVKDGWLVKQHEDGKVEQMQKL